MKIDDVKLLFEYNYWANKRILDTVEYVTPEQFVLPNTSSWGSLRGTVVHTLDAEYGWRLLLQDGVSIDEMQPEDFPDVDAIRAKWDEEEVAMWAYLNSLSDDDLEGSISYDVEEGTRNRVLWHCLVHVVNHGTQHRSESAAMLTDFGHSPGEIDLTVFTLTRS